MFKSYYVNAFTLNPSLVPDGITGDEYKIIDDDFEEYIYIINAGTFNIISEIVKLYEKRNLNVPANLVLLYKFIGEDIISFSKQENQPVYYKYKNEIEKYLSLI